MNKIYFWKCSNQNGYVIKRLKEIKTLEDLLKCYTETDLSSKFQMFAAFKNDYRPIQEDEVNKIKLTFVWKEGPKDYEKFLQTCWEERIFDKEEVNGIYCSNKKLSIWLKGQCEIKVYEKLGYRKKTQFINGFDLSTAENSVTKWTIGAFNRKYGKIPKQCKQFDPMKSEEKILFQYITDFLHFTEDSDGRGIFFNTNILNKSEERRSNMNNRFVNCSIQTSLKSANAILLKLFLSLPFSIFPQIPNIYLAFCFYSGGILEIGIYLTGSNKIFNEGSYKRTGDDPATIVAYKLKQIILEYCNPEENVFVKIINSVPAENSFFTDLNCEFEISNPRRRLIKI